MQPALPSSIEVRPACVLPSSGVVRRATIRCTMHDIVALQPGHAMRRLNLIAMFATHGRCSVLLVVHHWVTVTQAVHNVTCVVPWLLRAVT
jgi:hypothetical protein